MPVVAQGDRFLEIVGQRLEAAEMRRPPIAIELKSDLLRPSPVEKSGPAFGEGRGLDDIEVIGPKRENAGIGPIIIHRT
jgi:hypothetical protein